MFVITQNYIDRGYEVHYDQYTDKYAEFMKKDCVDDDVPDNADNLHEFILLDDDNMVYYRGFSDDSSSFEPLDWGMANAGCTAIMYKNNKTDWEYL